MTDELPDPDKYEWDFEKRDHVGIWDIRGWDGWADETLEAVSQHYRERASKDDIKSTLAVFGDKTKLPAETQEYMGEEWSDNGRYAGVHRVGFVAEGITGMAVRSKMDIPQAELADFDTLEKGLEWASDGQ
jgi:hypothetical protein